MRVPAAPDPIGDSRLFLGAFRKSRNGMVLLDRSRRVVDVNGAWVRLTGWSPDEMIGRHGYDFVRGGPKLSDREWARALRAGEFADEVDVVTSGDKTLSLQCSATAESHTGQGLVLLVVVASARWGEHFRRPRSEDAEDGEQLTRRECDVVELIALGESSREIAEELGVSDETVRTHARNAMRRLGARSRAQLVAKALAGDQLGLVARTAI
jgi:PAS domain S-box-containing protein